MNADDSALTADRRAYWRRAADVDRGAATCGATGPYKARCILPPGHSGYGHEGNGYDEWGPKYVAWKTAPPC